MVGLTSDLESDVAAVARIRAVPMILSIIRQTTGMRFAAVARVTEDRWIACSIFDQIDFGLQAGGELNLKTTLCNQVRNTRQHVIISHVDTDLAYRGHPTAVQYGFQSYISVPIITADGMFFGTLCAIDPAPADLDGPEIVGLFQGFAALIAYHLDAEDRLATGAETLVVERQDSELREQFIAVLGHDLRNPLAAIAAGAHLLLRQPLNEKSAQILQRMQGSIGRMSVLIDSVMDFARGRFGVGLTDEPRPMTTIGPALQQVVDELRVAWPERKIKFKADLKQPIACDQVRITQLLSNLLANAIIHGTNDGEVLVNASTTDGVFMLAVENPGRPIMPEMMGSLFLPFHRSASPGSSHGGLGLGLYIANMIAKEHGGTLEVVSDVKRTSFTLRMPTG